MGGHRHAGQCRQGTDGKRDRLHRRPGKKYIDLKKISDSIWIFSGTYAERMIYAGTTEPSADLGVDGDIYLQYPE